MSAALGIEETKRVSDGICLNYFRCFEEEVVELLI